MSNKLVILCICLDSNCEIGVQVRKISISELIFLYLVPFFL